MLTLNAISDRLRADDHFPTFQTHSINTKAADGQISSSLGPPQGMRFFKDGQLLVTCLQDWGFTFYDVSPHDDPSHRLRGYAACILAGGCLQFDTFHEGNGLVYATTSSKDSGGVFLMHSLDLFANRIGRSFAYHTTYITGVEAHEHNDWLLSTDNQGSVCLWDRATPDVVMLQSDESRAAVCFVLIYRRPGI